MSTAADRWREQLEAWAIPQRLIEAATESPYGFPAELFRRRGTASATEPVSSTTERALEALPADGEVLDVGVGGGATSLPLAVKAGRLTGVDQQADMLAAFESAAGDAGVSVATVNGGWPEVADDAPNADVVVCGHVAYNVADLGPFVRALNDHARRRVVMELTEHHPLSWMNDLWLRFHGLARPTGPSSLDAFEVIRELDLRPEQGAGNREGDPTGGGFARRGDAVALVRRRLCLPPERDAEIAEALGDRLLERGGLWAAGPARRVVATLWWDAT